MQGAIDQTHPGAAHAVADQKRPGRTQTAVIGKTRQGADKAAVDQTCVQGTAQAAVGKTCPGMQHTLL
jgi:hypothetical protein